MSERRTSAAKDILTPSEQSMLETYGVAKNHFEHARDPMISQQHMDLAREQAAEQARAERGGILANGGDRLPEYHPPSQQQGERSQPGSQMVREDQPQHNMRPPEEFARAADRESFDTRWYQEYFRAQEQDVQPPERDREAEREP